MMKILMLQLCVACYCLGASSEVLQVSMPRGDLLSTNLHVMPLVTFSVHGGVC